MHWNINRLDSRIRRSLMKLVFCSFFFIVIFAINVECSTLVEDIEVSDNSFLNISNITKPTNTKLPTKNLISSLMEFISTVSQILSPYLSFNLPGFNLPWETIENATLTFRQALGRIDPAVNKAGAAGMLAVGVGAVAGPYVVEVMKSILSGIVAFIDNLYFVATGEGLARSAIPDQLWDELLQMTLEHMT